MSKRLVTILWSIVGLLAALTLVVKSNNSKNSDAPTALSQGETLLKDLSLTEVSTIKLESADHSVTLQKDEKQWSVAERSDYQADFAKLTRLLRSLTEAAVAQNKKAGPAFNERFGMDPDAKNQENHGYQLSFLNAEGKELSSLSIGKATAGEGSATGSAGKYIRLGKEPEAIYAVNESFFDLTAKPADWLAGTFFSVTNIKDITLQPAKEDTIKGWSVSRKNAGSDFTIQNLAANLEPRPDQLNPLKNVLSGPSFEDVLTEEEAKERRDEGQARQITINTFDGFQYLLDYAPTKPKNAAETEEVEGGAPTAEDFILKVTVSANLPTERQKKEGETEEEAKKADADFASVQSQLKDKLAREQAFGERYYTIASYTLSALNVGAATLSKTPEPAASTPPPALPTAPPTPQFGPFR